MNGTSKWYATQAQVRIYDAKVTSEDDFFLRVHDPDEFSLVMYGHNPRFPPTGYRTQEKLGVEQYVVLRYRTSDKGFQTSDFVWRRQYGARISSVFDLSLLFHSCFDRDLFVQDKNSFDLRGYAAVTESITMYMRRQSQKVGRGFLSALLTVGSRFTAGCPLPETDP